MYYIKRYSMIFSKRYGFEKEKTMQIYEMDDDLRTSLLNIIYLHFFKNAVYPKITFLEPIWIKILKKDVSEINHIRSGNQIYNIVKREFYDNEWYKIYNIIEFIIQTSGDSKKISLTTDFNEMLENYAEENKKI